MSIYLTYSISSLRPKKLFRQVFMGWLSSASPFLPNLSPLSPSTTRFGTLIFWYMLFGALHELAHVITAISIVGINNNAFNNAAWLPSRGAVERDSTSNQEYYRSSESAAIPWCSWLWWLLQVLVFRQCSLEELLRYYAPQDQQLSAFFSTSTQSQVEDIVRHAGWIVSVTIVAVLWLFVRFSWLPLWPPVKTCAHTSGWLFPAVHDYGAPTNVVVILAAAVWTAIEALSTDLLQLNMLHLPLFPLVTVPIPKSTLFYCGNFGIIVLHQAWLYDNGKAALQVLDKMIQVTMMRGAQSGGVVVMLPESTKSAINSTSATLQRVRVVNKKRTALHTELIRKIQRSVKFPSKHDLGTNTEKVGELGEQKRRQPALLAGHTRFATSSKATLDGTHPQQWTPKAMRHVLIAKHTKQLPSTVRNENAVNSHLSSTKSRLMLFAWCPVENFVTHNGDFEFYTHDEKTYDLQLIQRYLSHITGIETPSPVDSCAVAGMVDVLRTHHCFSLSIRYALCFSLSTSNTNLHRMATSSIPLASSSRMFLTEQQLQDIAVSFEQGFVEVQASCATNPDGFSFEEMQQPAQRHALVLNVLARLKRNASSGLIELLDPYLDDEMGASLLTFCTCTIDAFWDNDLFWTMKTFMQNAKGSFGLTFITSMDAHRQVCLAARGQTMSIAFYPAKGLIAYGSEQAAVKAGMNVDLPSDKDDDVLGQSRGEIDDDALRLDLDDLGGEIVLLDWDTRNRSHDSSVDIVQPHKPDDHHHDLMNGTVHVVIHQQSKVSVHYGELYNRMTRLTRNPLIKPLIEEPKDLILQDIQDIPKYCLAIQDEWHTNKASTSLNRLSAFHLSRCLRKRLEAHIKQTVPRNAVDILITGCEVSLWVGEQFSSDLKKSFPLLNIQAVSSNKLLGLFGQDMMLPACGFPFSGRSLVLDDAIVIIISHSGGTFAPLACSSLLQSATRNLFIVTSEWDTQIGKQLRSMDSLADDGTERNRAAIFNSRIFSTEVGMRSAEPCSLSVVATHQLLTNLFEYMCAVILSDPRYRHATAAVITEQDLQMLEKCNRTNIGALVDIVGVNEQGYHIDKKVNLTEPKLRAAGDLWADHVLEIARAYIMSFLYIFTTVIYGYPLMYGLAILGGLDPSSNYMPLVRFLDAAIYFWLPQINITILRTIQKRNLLHRMVGRTVVIGDIPWVAQCAEAFLSKIFAVSYSIAGLNVLSANPADHLVHRHTHRVVRGTLLVCGRPDGRLSALSTAEAAVCLSVNQASSIQSHGGTCESITIGHNPFKLSLTAGAIVLKRKRPLYLCERMLVEADAHEEKKKLSMFGIESVETGMPTQPITLIQRIRSVLLCSKEIDELNMSQSSSNHDSSIRPRVNQKRSPSALLGSYSNIEESSHFVNNDREDIKKEKDNDEMFVSLVVEEAIRERKFSDKARNLFTVLDVDGDGFLTEEEFVGGVLKLKTGLSESELRSMFSVYTELGHDQSRIDYHEFIQLMNETKLGSDLKVPPSNRNERGVIQIEASREKYFGENIRKYNAGKSKHEIDFMAARSQHFAQELYETRIASMQRFVAMVIMFHQMGKRVENFFSSISFGWWGYRFDRTHSIMRIATTASPVSGADVKEQMRQWHLLKKVQHSVNVISMAYLHYKSRKAAIG